MDRLTGSLVSEVSDMYIAQGKVEAAIQYMKTKLTNKFTIFANEYCYLRFLIFDVEHGFKELDDILNVEQDDIRLKIFCGRLKYYFDAMRLLKEKAPGFVQSLKLNKVPFAPELFKFAKNELQQVNFTGGTSDDESALIMFSVMLMLSSFGERREEEKAILLSVEVKAVTVLEALEKEKLQKVLQNAYAAWLIASRKSVLEKNSETLAKISKLDKSAEDFVHQCIGILDE